MKVKSILAVMFVMSILTSFPLNQATTGFNPNLVNTDTSESENRGNTNPNAQLEYWVSAATYETSFTDEWSKVYATLNYDSFEDVVQCDDGGFAVVGTFDGTFGQFGKIYLLRTDSSGNHVWNETYPTGESQNRGMALVKCQDDGFAIAGNAGVNRILIRIADNGTELWRSTFTDDRGDSVKDLAYCEDGGFGILSYNGSSSWPPNTDYRLLRTDENGTSLWERAYSNRGYEESYDLTLLDDGGFAIIGFTQDIEGGGDEDIWMVRTDSSGIAVWNQTYGGSDYESGKAIAECENGDLIFTGSSRSYGSASLWVVRTTSTGNVLWNQTYGSDWDTGNSISNTADGGFVIGGHKSQNMDALAVRVNSLGDLLWTFDWGGVDVENCKTIIGCNEGDFLLVGRKTGTSVSDLDQLMLRIPDFPFWDEVPIDQMVASADPYSHDYNATLTHGLNTWWLESSPAFTINSSTGVVTNPSPLPEGDLPLVVGVTDLLGNWIKASLTITAYGDTPPVEVDDPIYIGQESDFVSYGFPGDGSSGNPYRIEDKVFWLNVTDWASRMISIVNTRSHFIIENCSFQGKNELQEIGSPTEWMWFGGIGVELWNVSNGVVRDCSFYIVSHGVFLITSSHITVEDCEMHNPLFDMPQPQGIGVQIDDASTRNIVVNNRLTSIGEGVFVANSTYNVIHLNVIRESNAGISTTHFARANIFSNNTCVFNLYEGIGFSRSNDTTVIMNNCSYNGHSGIFIDEESVNNTLLYNTLEGNGDEAVLDNLHNLAEEPISGYGVYVMWGSENNITWNDFVDNYKNAQNDESGNGYDYNYYSDYAGVDNDGDLIGETAYEITGDSPTSDPHPRMVRLNHVDGPSTTTPTTPTSPTTPADGNPFSDSLILVGVIAGGAIILVVIVVVMKKRT